LAAARDARRWLIGVSISVVFGLFGMVMALLGYLQGSRPGATRWRQYPGRTWTTAGIAQARPSAQRSP
jgi:hypothetical protein